MTVYCCYVSAVQHKYLPPGTIFTFHGGRIEKIRDGEHPEALHTEPVGSSRFSYAQGGVCRVIEHDPDRDGRGYRMSYEEVPYEEYQAEQSA